MRAFDIVKWWIEIPNDLSASRSKSTSNWRRANTTWNDNPAVNINSKEELFVSLIFTIMFVWNVHSICTISTHFSFHKNFMRILLFYWFYLRIYFCSKYLVFENLIFIDMTSEKKPSHMCSNHKKNFESLCMLWLLFQLHLVKEALTSSADVNIGFI